MSGSLSPIHPRPRPDLEPIIAGLEVIFALEKSFRSRLDDNLKAAEEAMREARRNPWVKGSTGQLREHPGFAVAARCDEQALRLYRELTAGLDELLASLGDLLRGT